jgi:hypothetical protein
MALDLWTPRGTVPLGTAPLGHNKETGKIVVRHTLLVEAKDDFGKVWPRYIVVAADPDTSPAYIEDAMAKAAEKWKTEVREKHSKRQPTAAEKKEIGRTLNDIRTHIRKRKDSTNRTIYYHRK